MKLYLSSYQIGSFPERLVQMVGPNKSVGLIQNAADVFGNGRREEFRKKYTNDLAELGFATKPLDLRDFVGKLADLKKTIDDLGMLYVVGGNTFSLRKAMEDSGLASLLPELLGKSDLVYAGFSAGICVLSPSLRGIHLADHPDAVHEPIWEGLGIIDFYIVPHYRSNHPESPLMEAVVEYYKDNEMRFECLADGEAIVVEGDNIEVLRNA